jgi:hypothetical protein
MISCREIALNPGLCLQILVIGFVPSTAVCKVRDNHVQAVVKHRGRGI